MSNSGLMLYLAHTGPFSSLNIITAPLPPHGFEAKLEFDKSVTLNPLEVYLVAIEMMSYIGNNLKWRDPIRTPISMSAYIFTTECNIKPVLNPRNRLRADMAVQGLYRAGVAIAQDGGFHKLRVGLLIRDVLYGQINFNPITHPGESVTNLYVDPLQASSTNATSVMADPGQIHDPYDTKFTIDFAFNGKTIKSQDVFTSFLNAMAIAAEHDNWNLNAYVPAAPSAAGEVVLSTWTVGAKDNPRMSWLRLKRAFLLIWERVVIARGGGGRPKPGWFGEFEFEFKYDGVDIGAGRLLRFDAAGNNTHATAAAK